MTNVLHHQPDEARPLPRIAGVVSDLDGVVFRGDVAIDTAVTAFAAWARRGIPYCFVTNNSTRSPQSVAQKLNAMGVAVDADRVITSTDAALRILHARWPQGGTAYVIGAPALAQAVEAAGFAPADSAADCVVVGLDRSFTYDKLDKAARLVRAGAVLVGTNPDPMIPSPSGFDPGCGSIVAAVATAAGATPIIAGKPERPLIDAAIDRLGVPRASIVMLGDQVSTDIVAGQRAGLFSILVRTGVPAPAHPVAVPDLTVDDLSALPQD